MTRARLFRLTLSLLLAAVVVSLGGLSFHRKVLGFQPLGFEADVRAGGAARVQWVGDRGTGLRVGDQVLLVNGAELTGAADFAGRLKKEPESRLTLVRGDQLIQVTYRRPALRVEISYLLLALIGVGYLLIGLFTLLRQPGRPGPLFCLWCLASAALYLLSAELAPLAAGPDLLYKLCFAADRLALLLLPALTLHLFLVFPEPLAWQRGPVRGRALAFLYLPAAVFLALEADAMGLVQALSGRTLAAWSADSLQLLERLELLQLALCSLAAVGVLVFRLTRGRVWEQQRQLVWVTVGLAGGYLPFFLFYGLPAVLGLRWPEPAAALAVLPLALVPITFAYAILRYKLWDIEVIVRDVAASTLTLLLGIIGFSLVNLAIVRGVPQDLSVARNLLSFASGLGIAGLLVPTRRTIASSLERLQYRGTFGKRRALSGLGRQLLHERDLGQLSAALVASIAEGVNLERANLYLAQGAGLAVLRPEPDLPPRLALDAFTHDGGTAFWAGDVRRLPGTGLPGEAPAPLQRLFIAGYRYAFPLTVLGNRVGVVLTGHKGEGAPLNSDDIALIRHLLDQAALAIENAQLLGQLSQRLEEVGNLQRYSEGILESSPAGIAVIDVAGERVVSANAAFARLAEVDREALPGRPLAELLPVSPLPTPGEPPLEISFCDREGHERHLQLSLAEYAGALPGEPAGGASGSLRILVVHDVSERVAMETALKEKDRLAALGLLAAGVAHEVNTPITGISSYAQMLLDDLPEGDPHREILKKMERQTFRAARIVNNLLGYARNRSSERRPVALAPLLAETVDLLSDRIRKRRVEVRWQLPAEAAPLSPGPAAGRTPADRAAADRDSDPCVVLACDGELQQVFTNLLLNAVDAMGEGGGRLTLALEADGELVRARVADTGPGIPPERLDRIFQPFFSTKLSSGGTGLGLAISYDIVRRHGGTLTVASEPGAGACFTVELPRLLRQQVPA